MAITVVNDILGTGTSSTSSTTVVITTTATVPVGDFIVVSVATDNLSATTPTFTAADSAGNTYTTQIQLATNATADAGVAGAIITSNVTSQLASGGTITVTMSGAVVNQAAQASSYNGVGGLRGIANSAEGVSASATVTSNGDAFAGDVVFGAVAVESRQGVTFDSDTVNGTWSAGHNTISSTGGADHTRVQIINQYKVITGTGTQTYDITNSNTDWVAMICAFAPITTGTSATTLAPMTASGSGSTGAAPTSGSGSPSLARVTGAGDGSTGAPGPSGSGSPSLTRVAGAGVGDTVGPWTTFDDGVSATTGATVAGLTNGVGYEFRVAAVNSEGQADWSNIAGPYTPTSSSVVGSGSPSLARHAAAGSGTTTVPGVTGSSATTLARHEAAGVGQSGTTGSGSPSLQRATGAGSGSTGTSGSGSPSLARHDGAGVGQTGVSGSGSPSLARVIGAGSGTHTPPGGTGSGSPVLARHDAAGVGSTTAPSTTGSGSPLLARVTGVGVGSTGTTGSGSVSLARHGAAGSGLSVPPGSSGSGSPALSRLAAVGSGSTTIGIVTGFGAPVLGRIAASGSGAGPGTGTTTRARATSGSMERDVRPGERRSILDVRRIAQNKPDITVGTAEPAQAALGDFWFDLAAMKYWDGSDWVELDPPPPPPEPDPVPNEIIRANYAAGTAIPAAFATAAISTAVNPTGLFTVNLAAGTITVQVAGTYRASLNGTYNTNVGGDGTYIHMVVQRNGATQFETLSPTAVGISFGQIAGEGQIVCAVNDVFRVQWSRTGTDPTVRQLRLELERVDLRSGG